MASVRLTNFDRDEIRSKALKVAFDERDQALVAREHQLAKEAYEATVPEAERAAAAKMPPHWLKHETRLWFNVAGSCSTLNVGEKGVPVPRSNETRVIKAGKLADKIMSFMGDCETYKADREKASVALRAMLASCSTTGKLAETWPEGRPFFGHLEAAREKAAVPTIRIAEINKLLGIKDAA